MDVRAFGAVGDGSTDDSVAIQAAIDSITEGVVFLPPGVWAAQGLVQPSRVIIQGAGKGATTLKLVDGANTDLLLSEDFATLTGSGAWYVDTEGVPWGFGLMDLEIDGNKANNTAGYGVKWYGKPHVVRNVLVRDCKQIGFYSECGITVGQHDYRDLPEGKIDSLTVRNCDGDGAIIRGPHDLVLRNFETCHNGGWGAQIQTDGSNYQGACVCQGDWHAYGNTTGGFNIETTVGGAGRIYDEDGAVISGSRCGFAGIEAFSAARSLCLEVTGFNNRLGEVLCNPSDTADSGLKIHGSSAVRNKISSFSSYGAGGAGTGVALDIDDGADYNRVLNFHVEAYNGSGGVGVQVGATALVTGSRLDGTVEDCETLINYSNGNHTRADLYLVASSGQTNLSGNPQNRDIWSMSSGGANPMTVPVWRAMKGYCEWYDGSGNLRRKAGVPAADNEGVVVGP